MNEIVFEVTQEADGGFVARCLTEAIFAQADNWQELREQVRDAVDGYFFDRQTRPPICSGLSNRVLFSNPPWKK